MDDKTCQTCDGSGDCQECGGFGYDDDDDDAGKSCPNCDGSGDCPDCDGTGEDDE